MRHNRHLDHSVICDGGKEGAGMEIEPFPTLSGTTALHRSVRSFKRTVS